MRAANLTRTAISLRRPAWRGRLMRERFIAMVAFYGATQRQEAFYGVSPRHCAKPRHRNGGCIPVSPMAVVGTAEHSGTEVHFLPDAQIFGKVEFHYDILAKRMRELS